MPNSTLYAWVVPADFKESPVDHTWVTDYDNRSSNAPQTIEAVEAAGQNYWYCWGSFHPKGGTDNVPDGSIGTQAGDLGLAKCLVQSNASSMTTYAARGTIYTYGIDGVCHQLANQVLFATGGNGVAPLTVSRARGYWFSSFVYGTYGLQSTAFLNKIATCSGTSASVPMKASTHMTASTASNHPDDFEAHLLRTLGSARVNVVAPLLAHRATFQAAAALAAHSFVVPAVDQLNARNQQLLDHAAAILTRDEFFKVFGFPPGTKIDLVLPSQVP